MAMGVWCAETKRHKGLVWSLIATLILGLGFLGIKADEYHEKYVLHHIPGSFRQLQRRQGLCIPPRKL